MPKRRHVTKIAKMDWRGSVVIGTSWARWRGATGDAAPHRHFAAQAVFAETPIEVEDSSRHKVSARCVLIDPMVAHRLLPAPDTEILFIEPQRCLDAQGARILAKVLSMPSVALLGGRHRFWNEQLRQAPVSQTSDRRISQAIDEIAGSVPDCPSADEAAIGAGLSLDRFRHLFVEQTGLSYGRFLLWRRLLAAMRRILAGEDVTTAAHSAGFADAAHFARTMKAAFGVTASQALIGSGIDRELNEVAK